MEMNRNGEFGAPSHSFQAEKLVQVAQAIKEQEKKENGFRLANLDKFQMINRPPKNQLELFMVNHSDDFTQLLPEKVLIGSS